MDRIKEVSSETPRPAPLFLIYPAILAGYWMIQQPVALSPQPTIAIYHIPSQPVCHRLCRQQLKPVLGSRCGFSFLFLFPFFNEQDILYYVLLMNEL